MGKARSLMLLSALAGFGIGVNSGFAQPAVLPPQLLYGALFEAVQQHNIFADSKSFADAIALAPADSIVSAYQAQMLDKDFDLKKFVQHYFRFSEQAATAYHTGSEDICSHIDNLWPVLARQPLKLSATDEQRSSLIALHYPYIVPGGRFREIYYWDSYFTMLGLRQSGENALLRAMVQNFADLIRRFGHAPNGNRSYYLDRSQPPFFALMVDLLAELEGEQVYQEFLPALQQEYAFWMMKDAAFGASGQSRRVVRMPNGAVLNRYYSDSALPRDESWAEDKATAARSAAEPAAVFRNLRAGAESGWDFSSRWLKDAHDLSTIRTLDIVPVDLNSLLYHLEQVLAKSYQLANNDKAAGFYRMQAMKRKAAINHYLWNRKTGFYADYIATSQIVSDEITAASLYPLFFKLADDAQASAVATQIQQSLVKPGGLVTTAIETGQQWDAPNVWAPLQWIAVQGLRAYHQDALAFTIADHWTRNVWQSYQRSRMLKEKYRAYQLDQDAGGGEYPNQDGFGWTNGVMLALLRLLPDLPVAQSCHAAAKPHL